MVITQWDPAVQEPVAKLGFTFTLIEMTSELILLVTMCLFAVGCVNFCSYNKCVRAPVPYSTRGLADHLYI